MSFRLAEVVTPDGHLRYIVVEGGGSIVGPIAGYLRYLDDTGKARNTLRVYGLGLAHYFAYLRKRASTTTRPECGRGPVLLAG